MKKQKEKRKDLMLETLTILNTVKSDNGTYSCNVTDNQFHSSYESLYVKIFGENNSQLHKEVDKTAFHLQM